MSDTPSPTPASPATAILAQAQALWAKLPARARTAAIASTVAIAGLVLYLIINRGADESWVKVTEGLDKNDVTVLIGELDKAGVPHRLRNGKDVLVPASKHDAALAVAISAGVPNAHPIVIEQRPTETMAAFLARLQIALQNRITRSLERLGPIESASVQVVPTEKSPFVRGTIPATASLQVHVRPGTRLSPAQVAGIKQFVAHSVANLSIENVTVIDQNANLLSEASDDPDELRSSEEQKLTAKIREIIEPVVGADKVKVTARIEYDRRTIQTTDESFHDPTVRSTDTTTTGGAPATPVNTGVAGTPGNLPGTPNATTTTAPGGAGAITKQVINNEVGRKVVQTQDPAERIAKISVVVLLADGVDENGEPKPRTPEDLTKFTKMAHGAAGLDDARGDQLIVEAMTFAPPPEVAVVMPPKGSKLPVPMPVALGGGAAVLIAAAVLLARKRRKPAEDTAVRIALPAPVAELERALSPTPIGETPEAPQLPPGRSLEERVFGTIKADIPRASRVLASWLAEPDPLPPTNPKSARA